MEALKPKWKSLESAASPKIAVFADATASRAVALLSSQEPCSFRQPATVRLHPQVQRLVYRHFLAEADEAEAEDEDGDEAPAPASRLTTILTTHSPHIASIAPLRSLVLLRRDGAGDRTVGVSTAKTPLTAADKADRRRYRPSRRRERHQ